MRLLILSVLVITALAKVTFAEDMRIKLPEDYRSKYTNYLNLDRTQEEDQVIHLYANDIAMEGMGENGEFPNGSILVGEVYKAKKDEDGEVIESLLGHRIPEKFALIAIMEKREGWGSDFKEEHKNGDWDFAAFNPDGTIASSKDLNECRTCHAPLTDADHVFSFEHINR